MPDTDFTDFSSFDIPDTQIPFTPGILGNPSPFFGPPVSGLQPIPSGGQPSPFARNALLGIGGLLGAGALAGVGQNLFGRPPTTTTRPQLSPQQGALLTGAQGQFGQSGNILQMLLGAIQSPQIPPQLSLLAEQAFQPQLGDLFSQAVNQGRLRGFQDAPATSPPGGAILGPGLAALQGQLAQAKLNLFQNNIGNLLGALQGSQQIGRAQGALASVLPTPVRQQAPQPSILQTIGQVAPVLGGLGGLLSGLSGLRDLF